MKILIVSDTHRNNANYLRVLKMEQPLDLIIHCGDAEGSEYIISEAADCPVEIVLGNNDFFSDLPKEKEIMVGKFHVLITHGHYYYVTTGNELIKREARARGMDIVIYGHTHRPVVDIDNEITALNPGSLTYPRQDGKKPSYIIMNIDDNGQADFSIHYL